jgi:hypothetical protein
MAELQVDCRRFTALAVPRRSEALVLPPSAASAASGRHQVPLTDTETDIVPVFTQAEATVVMPSAAVVDETSGGVFLLPIT